MYILNSVLGFIFKFLSAESLALPSQISFLQTELRQQRTTCRTSTFRQLSTYCVVEATCIILKTCRRLARSTNSMFIVTDSTLANRPGQFYQPPCHNPPFFDVPYVTYAASTCPCLHSTEAWPGSSCRVVFSFYTGQCRMLIAALVLTTTYSTEPFDRWATGRVLLVEEKVVPSSLYQTYQLSVIVDLFANPNHFSVL